MTAEWIFAGGLLQFTILAASALVPSVLEWRSQLAKLSHLTRQVIWVHGAYVVLMIVGLALVSVALPAELVSGDPLGRAVCGFTAVFWGVRLLLQFVHFRPGEILERWWLRLGYSALTVVFSVLTVIYTGAAIWPRL